MYIDDLIKLFEKASGHHHELRAPQAINALRKALEAKKYDLQDEGLIEAIIRDEEKEILQSFRDQMELLLGGNEEASKYLSSPDGIKESVNIFINSLEYLINYYYNNLISKHFSNT